MKKRRKSYSVDAVIRFFLHYYNIPTKQDIEKLAKKIERLEEAVKANKIAAGKVKKAAIVKGAARKKEARRGVAGMTATEKTLAVIKRSSSGVDVAGLKAKTGFEDKKIRNIVFTLSKQGIIKRVGRGVYAIQ